MLSQNRMKIVLGADRVQLAISWITEVEEKILFPAGMATAHPIRLVKEAEQCIAHESCVLCPSVHSNLEQHHVAGKANYPDTITLCEPCHDELSQIYQPTWLPWVLTPLACYVIGWRDIFHLIWVKTNNSYFLELAKKFAQNARYAK